MMNQIAARDSGDILESVIAKGDLGKLTPAERVDYYRSVCQSIGLNPLTQPLSYISLQGKLTLYAKRDAADQLRKLNGISIEIVERSVMDGLFVVHVRAKDASGRTDEDLGVVSIAGLKGEMAANAQLKAITKAKRRVTLSISGLGFLDETEVESVQSLEAQLPRKSSAQAKRDGDWERLQAELADCTSVVTINKLQHSYQENEYKRWNDDWREQADEAFEKRRQDFGLAPGEALSLREQLAGSLEDDHIKAAEDALPDIPPFLDRRSAKPEAPTTRAEYVQHCHDAIEAFTELDSLRPWWEKEAPARKRFSLNQAEIDGLKERLAAKRHEILQKLEARESTGK